MEEIFGVCRHRGTAPPWPLTTKVHLDAHSSKRGHDFLTYNFSRSTMNPSEHRNMQFSNICVPCGDVLTPRRFLLVQVSHFWCSFSFFSCKQHNVSTIHFDISIDHRGSQGHQIYLSFKKHKHQSSFLTLEMAAWPKKKVWICQDYFAEQGMWLSWTFVATDLYFCNNPKSNGIIPLVLQRDPRQC